MGSDCGEFWRRILRFRWFGHQSLFDLIPTFVVACATGHLASVDMVLSFVPVGHKSNMPQLQADVQPAETFPVEVRGEEVFVGLPG